MSKIEEIAFKYAKGEYPTQQMFSLLDVMSAMKEYAEHYAQKCLETAETHLENEDNGFQRVWPLSIKLPDHD